MVMLLNIRTTEKTKPAQWWAGIVAVTVVGGEWSGGLFLWLQADDLGDHYAVTT